VNRITKDNIRKFYNTAFNARKNIKQMLGSFKPKWAVNSRQRTGINGKRQKKEEEDKRRIKKYL
jgi:hypothetical protein